MSRHAVRMHEMTEKAWESAERWHLIPIILEIDIAAMSIDGYSFGVTKNDICIETVPGKSTFQKKL